MAKEKRAVRLSDNQPRRGIALGDTALTVLKRGETVSISKGFDIDVNGLTVSGNPSFEQWEKAQVLRVIEKGAQFALGDYINYGEDKFGEKASQVIDPENGWSESTCAVYAWLAHRISPDRRRMDRLSIRHHMEVAKLTALEQQDWLTKAANDHGDEPWTIKELQRAMSEPGGPLPAISDYLVVVSCPSGQVQDQLMERLKAEGLSCEARLRRRKGRSAQAA